MRKENKKNGKKLLIGPIPILIISFMVRKWKRREKIIK